MTAGLRRGDGLALGSAGLIAGSAVALWMLHRPRSWVSQWLNRQVDEALQWSPGTH